MKKQEKNLVNGNKVKSENKNTKFRIPIFAPNSRICRTWKVEQVSLQI